MVQINDLVISRHNKESWTLQHWSNILTRVYIVQIKVSFILDCFRNHLNCSPSYQRWYFCLFYHFFNHTFHIFIGIIKNYCFDFFLFG